MKTNLTYLNFTQNVPSLQLLMNFDVDTQIPQDSKVRLACNIVERMDLSQVMSTYSRKGRKPVVDPITLFKIILFAYSEGIFSCRKIESFCLYDIRARYILNGQVAPSYSTIDRFRQLLVDHTQNLLTQYVQILLEENHLDLESIYIDGTKVEAVANRYTFVWRKSVEKYQSRLKERIIKEFNMPTESTLKEVQEKITYEFRTIQNLCKRLKIEFVFGSGKRKTQHQRDYEYLKDVASKFEKYEHHLEVMGDRNSYSKTDTDATFMRMKDDHMRNGQLKPAYNIQMASSGAFIVGVMGSQKANDLHTLKPFLEKMIPSYGDNLHKIVADAGYESSENYTYLKEKNLAAYIKPANHELQKKKKTKDDIGRKENMLYLAEQDAFVCHAGKLLNRQKDRTRKSTSGFVDTMRVYSCFECSGCEYASQCIKTRTTVSPSRKNITFSPAFEEFRKESAFNISTEEGIDERINRSIQAEGVFSKLKDGLRYDRFRHRGLKSVVSDIELVALGINLNKLHNKIQKGQTEIIRYRKPA